MEVYGRDILPKFEKAVPGFFISFSADEIDSSLL
jgi:hypothetical protein